jgi:hypothetical protein
MFHRIYGPIRINRTKFMIYLIITGISATPSGAADCKAYSKAITIDQALIAMSVMLADLTDLNGQKILCWYKPLLAPMF